MKTSQFVTSWLSQHRLLFFLGCILALLMSFPFIHEWFSNYLGLVEVFFTLLMIICVYVINRDPKILTVASLIAILTSTIMWFNFILNSLPLLITGLLFQICFFTLTTYTILNYVLSYHRVNEDTIYGAISAYLLMGIIWALIFTTLELAMPDSFKFSQALFHNNAYIAGHRFYFSQFLYFSFVTLTTLGYGDIVPITLGARGFSSLEAIAGQLYVAVLIARLVGLHISHSHWERIQQEESRKDKFK